MPRNVLLSSISVYPESTATAFELASRLGYDGIELMVGVETVAADITAVEKLSQYYQCPVKSVHAPCLIVSPHVWGMNSWGKLKRAAEAATRLGADVVVVHPPFRWQSNYAAEFVEGIRKLAIETGIMFAVENMYPWRAKAVSLPAYLPHWDPTDLDYDDLTLDMSHASTAQKKSMDYVHKWGKRLKHVHFTDGRGSFKDEHLMPGQGDQDSWQVLAALVNAGFEGHIVVEVSTRNQADPQHREQRLRDCLVGIKQCLETGDVISESNKNEC